MPRGAGQGQGPGVSFRRFGGSWAFPSSLEGVHVSAPTAESRRIPWRPLEAQGTGRSRAHPGPAAASQAEIRLETCGSPGRGGTAPASAPASAGTFPGLKCACGGQEGRGTRSQLCRQKCRRPRGIRAVTQHRRGAGGHRPTWTQSLVGGAGRTGRPLPSDQVRLWPPVSGSDQVQNVPGRRPQSQGLRTLAEGGREGSGT